MDLKLDGKTAVVTAASEGLGYGCAETLVREGAHVVICGRSVEKLEKARQKLAAIGGKIHAYQCDLSESDSLTGFIKKLEEEKHVPDILVISTSHPPTKPFSQATLADWEKGHSLLIGPQVTLCQHFIPGMAEKEYGRIILIGSIFGREHEESSVIQSTYRTGLHGFAKCLAREYARYNITVNVVCPGYFDTPLVHRLAQQYADEKKVPVTNILDDWKTASPANRYGTLKEFGALVAYLASPLGGFVNGSAITIDGATTRST